MEPRLMSERMLHKVLGWIGVGVVATAASLFASPAMAQSPSPFGACPIEAYQTIQADDLTPDTYSLYTINVADGSITNVGSDPDMQGNNGGNTNGINAIGFNENDRFIYGWNNSVRQVVRVGQGGVAEFVGPTPPGMASVNAVVGDVFNQRLYLWNNAGGGTLAIVNLVTNTLETTLTTSGVSSMNDWAFSSTDGNLYYVRNSDGAVVRVNPTTGVGTVVPGVTVPTGATFGAQYFDNQGSLYASRNDGRIFRVRNATGGGTPSVELLTSAAPATQQNDGARCPNAAPPVPSISLQKQITAESGSIPGTAEPNELLTYTFTLTNAGTQSQTTPYPFFEVLPANTTLVSVSGGSSDCPVGSTGARLCTMTHPGPIAANGGTATMSMVVRVADPIPVGVTQILNLVMDSDSTPPPGCSASNQTCPTPPTCSPTSDPNHCVVVPVQQFSADLAITKTNTFGSGPNDQPSDTVVSGSTQSYVIVVSNNGPDAANGAIVRDPAPTGLTCSAVTCSNATGGATCATTPALTVANLQSAGGVAIDTLPSGGSVRLTLTCTVN